MSTNNAQQAFIQALFLSVTAPTDEQAMKCIKYASHIASSLTTEEADACQAIAEFQAEQYFKSHN